MANNIELPAGFYSVGKHHDPEKAHRERKLVEGVKLRPCPFCGNAGMVIVDSREVDRCYNKHESHEGYEFLYEYDVAVRKRINGVVKNVPVKKYRYREYQFNAGCGNPSCVARQTAGKYRSLQQAIERWNTRTEVK